MINLSKLYDKNILIIIITENHGKTIKKDKMREEKEKFISLINLNHKNLIKDAIVFFIT